MFNKENESKTEREWENLLIHAVHESVAAGVNPRKLTMQCKTPVNPVLFKNELMTFLVGDGRRNKTMRFHAPDILAWIESQDIRRVRDVFLSGLASAPERPEGWDEKCVFFGIR